MKSKILLESGTGEVEVLEFKINNQFYAINVIKTKEVINIGNVTKLPQSNPEIAGVMVCRDELLTLIDLNYVINNTYSENKNSKVIVCEFNKVKVAFIVDDVLGIHRVGWEKISKPDDISATSLVIGNILLKDKVLILLDFEKIVTDISPKTGISEERMVNVEYRDRSKVKIALVDDSALIRKLLKETLIKAGFKNLTLFDNGKEAEKYLLDLVDAKGENFKDEVEIVITDIEMPKMDGHTLTRKIKEHPLLRSLPVIIFSSLITEDLMHKGKSVGADAQLSKPDISELVDVVDKFIENM